MSKRITTVSIRLEEDEKEEWQQLANNKFDGSLSRMIRSLITRELYSTEQKETNIDLEAIEKIMNRTTQKYVSELKSDLFVLKSMLKGESQIATQDHSLKDIVKLKAKEYLLNKDRIVSFDELFNYLKLECEECTLFFRQVEQMIPGGAKIELLDIHDQVLTELYESTGSDIFKGDNNI